MALESEGSDGEQPRVNINTRKERKAAASKASNPYDSDEEREKAHRMFSDDLQDLRRLFLKIMDDQIQT